MTRRIIALAIGLLCTSSTGAFATEAAQRGSFTQAELQIALGMLPKSDEEILLAAKGAITLRFGKYWGWRVVSGLYATHVADGLKADLRRRFDAQPDEAPRPKAIFASSLLIRPIGGRLSAGNRSNIDAELYFVTGPAVGFFDEGQDVALNLGVGIRMRLDRHIAVSFELREHVFARRGEYLYMGLGLGLLL